MTATTIIHRIARVSLGLAVAGVVLGQTGTAFADTPVAPAAYAPSAVDPASAQNITLTGSTTAEITTAAVSCTRLADAAYAWELKTDINGVPLDITFNTNNYRGATTYNTTGVTDENGGLMTLGTDTVQVATNGFSTGTFTVDQDETTGSINADLDDFATNQLVHVTGTWTCS